MILKLLFLFYSYVGVEKKIKKYSPIGLMWCTFEMRVGSKCFKDLPRNLFGKTWTISHFKSYFQL
jgi:hypothetical protein